MGSGTSRYKRFAWRELANGILFAIEAALYVLFVIDCFVLAAGTRSYFPPGGFSLILFLLVISLVHRLRCGKDYS